MCPYSLVITGTRMLMLSLKKVCRHPFVLLAIYLEFDVFNC